MKPHERHRADAKKQLRFHLVTVSTSRYEARGKDAEDESGNIAERIIRGAGHSVGRRDLIPDDVRMLRSCLRDFMASSADVLVFSGGTGLSGRDVTIETVRPYLQKELDGFGELLREKSFEKIGAAAILSRATAGVVKGKLIVCLPGSPDAVETGLNLFILEMPHAIHIAKS